MLEKAKQVVLYILTPITVLFGVIYYLLTKTKHLEDQLASAKANRELDKVKEKIDEAGRKANDEEEKYRIALDDFKSAMREHEKQSGRVPD